MILMENYSQRAIAKLEKERKDIPILKDNEIGAKLTGKNAADAKASLMADAVLNVLTDFCRQSEGFAKAVISGGTFGDCMKAAAMGVGNYAQGADVCKKCVQFYLPGANIHVQWRVEMPEESNTADSEKEKQTGFVLDLMDLLK